MNTEFNKNINIEIEREKEEARKLTEEGNITKAAVTWDIVEELSASAADQSWFDKFCDQNPNDPSCKMYDV